MSVGDSIPNVSLDKGFPPTKVPLAEFCKGKKIVLVGLPGEYAYIIIYNGVDRTRTDGDDADYCVYQSTQHIVGIWYSTIIDSGLLTELMIMVLISMRSI